MDPSAGQRVSRFLADVDDTAAFAARLAKALKPGTIVYLRGPLGAGKTTLVRALLKIRGFQGRVRSPTYTLVESYPGVAHFDLYRLAAPEELEWLGLRDYLDGRTICLIEWPEKGKGLLPPPDLEIVLQPKASGRQLWIEACSPRGERILKELVQI